MELPHQGRGWTRWPPSSTTTAACRPPLGPLAREEHADWRALLSDEPPSDPPPLAEAFAHEVRRYYPFVPVLTGRAREDFELSGQRVERGQRILLDVYGTNHSAEWGDPWSFLPGRFLDVDPCDISHFIPQ